MIKKLWQKIGEMTGAVEDRPVALVWIKRIGLTVLGGVAGYAYYHFIGCVSGSCPITSNPWLSILAGAVLGASFVPKKEQVEQP